MTFAKLICMGVIVVAFSTWTNAMADSKHPEGSSPIEVSPGSSVHGSEQPEKIHDYFKYQLLIAGYELSVRGDLADKLSSEDQQVLRDLAARDPIERERITEEYRQARLHICANRGSMTPVEIAREWDRIALEWRLKNEAH